jgi:hypothetical protein
MENGIIIPLRISFNRWTDHLNQILPNLSIPISWGEENWREWANQLISTNSLSTVPVATELNFPKKEDWRKWATYFITIINLP